MDPSDAACGTGCQVGACRVGTGIMIGSDLKGLSTSTCCVVGAMVGNRSSFVMAFVLSMWW